MKDKTYTERLIKYAEKIMNYMKDIESFTDFQNLDEKIDAVILNLEQIGETARKISQGIKDQFMNINWTNIIGLRNMISHEYEGINTQIIFDIAKNEIPTFLLSINQNISKVRFD